MKLFKKVLSVAAAVALVVTAVPANAKAATDVYDFEDGVVPAGIVIHTNNDTGAVDGDPSIISVVDFQGSKMLKIDNTGVDMSKVRFVLAGLVGADNAAKVAGLEYDMILENAGGTTVPWQGGTIIAGNWAAGNGWYNGTGWSAQDDNKNITDVIHLKELMLPGFSYKDPTDTNDAFFLFMNWGNDPKADVYIDNLKVLDADGNPLPLVTAAVEAATDAAPADDTAAADVPKTGVVGFGILYGLGALTTGAVALKRKQR